MTQGDLAAAVGYSVSFVSSLETEKRLPTLDVVVRHFIPALGLQDEPRLAARLVELAAEARGVRPPSPLTISQRQQVVEIDERGGQIDGYAAPLPALPSATIGRATEVKLLCNRLLGHRGRLLTLVGPPGIGKTRLALEIAARLSPLFQEGAHFVPLAATQDAALLAPAVGAQFAIPSFPNQTPDERLLTYLRQKQLLLILDNFEQLLAPASGINPAVTLLSRLLTECPHLQIIVTSREQLHLRAEQRYKVQPLALDAAVELFLHRSRLMESELFCAEKMLPTVRQICQELDCLPLALELAAAHTDHLSPSELLARVAEHRLDLLVDGAVDLPPSQRTLRGAIQTSFELLTDEEQALFCRLGVFVGSFAMPAIVALQGTPAVVKALVSKNMLGTVAQAECMRFVLLETLREFALEKLAPTAAEDVYRQHAQYFAELARTASMHMHGSEKLHYLNQLEREYEHLRTALKWKLLHEPESALVLAVNMDEFWSTRGFDQEAAMWLERVTALDLPPTAARAHALLAASSCHRRLGQYALAERELHEAKLVARHADDGLVWLKLYQGWGWHLYDLHGDERSLLHFQRGLECARSQANRTYIVRFLAAIAHVQRECLDLRQQVTGYLDECLLLLQELDDPEVLAFVLQQYGNLEATAHQYEAATTYYEKMQQIYRRLDNKLGLAWALELMAEVAWFQRELTIAQQQHEEAHAIFVRLGNLEGIMISLHHMAQVARRKKECAKARAYYLTSLGYAHSLGNYRMMARCLAGLGGVALLEEDLEQAALLTSAAYRQFATLPPFLASVDRDEFNCQSGEILAFSSVGQVESAWNHGQAQPLSELIVRVLATVDRGAAIA